MDFKRRIVLSIGISILIGLIMGYSFKSEIAEEKEYVDGWTVRNKTYIKKEFNIELGVASSLASIGILLIGVGLVKSK